MKQEINYLTDGVTPSNTSSSKTGLTEFAKKILTELGINLSTIDSVSSERIRNINFIFSEDNYSQTIKSCHVFIKFANDLLKSELTEKSKKMINDNRSAKNNSTCIPAG